MFNLHSVYLNSQNVFDLHFLCTDSAVLVAGTRSRAHAFLRPKVASAPDVPALDDTVTSTARELGSHEIGAPAFRV